MTAPRWVARFNRHATNRLTLPLAPRLPGPLAALYAALAVSEARHFELYVGFAQASAPGQWRRRLGELAAREAQLATGATELLRFHSGPLSRAGAR